MCRCLPRAVTAGSPILVEPPCWRSVEPVKTPGSRPHLLALLRFILDRTHDSRAAERSLGSPAVGRAVTTTAGLSLPRGSHSIVPADSMSRVVGCQQFVWMYREHAGRSP